MLENVGCNVIRFYQINQEHSKPPIKSHNSQSHLLFISQVSNKLIAHNTQDNNHVYNHSERRSYKQDYFSVGILDMFFPIQNKLINSVFTDIKRF